jgi:RNA polymerase sigma-70 factor (ECF subfamily)
MPADDLGAYWVIGSSFKAVLAGAVAGDERAYAKLWRDLNPSLVRYLRVLADGIAEDVASETWLEVVRGLDRFVGDEAGFRSWIFTIGRYRALDALRRAARDPVAQVSEELLADAADDSDAADAALETLSTEAALALIACLPPDQAEVVALRVVANLDVARVAEIVGKRPGTVRVLCHRGLRRLAERLEHVARVEGVTQ